MSGTKDLLVEIGTEELPPRSLVDLATHLAAGIRSGLDACNLAHGECRWYATPRRLAVAVDRLVTGQPDFTQTRRGPSTRAAYDKDRKPTPALEGFIRSCGAGIEDLETETTDKGSWLVYRQQVKGRQSRELLPEIINNALQRLPIPRRMRWGTGRQAFVRPVHWSIVLLGRDVVPCEILGTSSGNESRGHRFHHPGPVRITSARTYAAKLESKAHVIADFDERRERIRGMVIEAAGRENCQARIDAELLDEVTSLVEWPAVVTGRFDSQYLALPDEVLLATLQEHQRYFPLTGPDGKFAASFVTIANLESSNVDEVRRGNERVIAPRLSDAAFFWRQDTRRPLEYYRERLQDVVYQKNLGTLADKTRRIRALCNYIAELTGEDTAVVERAAQLSKCDLLTDMVGEFPKLQGIMGRYYAVRSGEAPGVAQAIAEQYMPGTAGSPLPLSAAGRILSVADRLDTLAGLFGTGQQPSGEKDPFGLRRAALGIVRILIEQGMHLPVDAVVTRAVELFNGQVSDKRAEIKQFIYERLSGYMRSSEFTQLEIDSVLQNQPDIKLVPDLLAAVREFIGMPEADSLVAANKRVANILRQAENNGEKPGVTDPGQLREPEENSLYRTLSTATGVADDLYRKGDFTGYLKSFAVLKDPVDAFFETVMVMVDDRDLRRNRLAMLRDLRIAMNKVADISMLQVQAK